MTGSPAGRFRVAPGALREGTVTIGAAEAHHMRVRRIRAGAAVVLFDGEGNEADARIESIEEWGATARVQGVRRSAAESPLRVVLLQALPVKLPRMDEVVRQATELGVARVVPVATDRGRLPGGGSAALARRRERWRRIAEAAAKQCGRAEVPEIDPVRVLREVDPSALPAPLLLLDPAAAGALRREPVSGSAVTLAIGPEGGWSDAERERLESLGARAIAFGPRVLRADTAGPAVLAVLQYLAGDLAGGTRGLSR